MCDRPTDERQGSTATLGFSFQQWWAALRAVELLAGTDDFAVGMEVKEDVALLDSVTEPTHVEFCQVKKNERANAWSLKDLYRKGVKKKTGCSEPSTIAKLYRRRHEFVGHKTRLRFVSNTSFKLPAVDGKLINSTDARLTDLTADHQIAVKKSIAEQLSVPEERVDLNAFVLHTTNMPLAEPEKFVAGKLMELCEKGIIQFQISKPNTVARMIASELQSRAASTNYAMNFEDLRERLMSRAEVMGVLTQVCDVRPTIESTLETAIERLDSERYSFQRVRQIRRQVVRVCVDAVDRTNVEFRAVVQAVNAAKDPVEANLGEAATLSALLDGVVEHALPAIRAIVVAPDLGYVNAIALVVLNDGLEKHLLTSQADKKSKEEE